MNLVAPYEHQQPLAKWIYALMAGAIAFQLALAAIVPAPDRAVAVPVITVAICLLVAITWMISVMHTRVDARGVSWSLAWGWPGGTIAFAQIASAELTELNWMERGKSGLTWTKWHGWLWHAAGSHALEIITTGGRRVTLGTDDPQGLAQAIERFRRGAA